MLNLIKTVVATGLIAVSSAAGPRQFSEDDLILSNRGSDKVADPILEHFETVVAASQYKTYTVLHRFGQTSGQEWRERSQLVVGLDNRGHIVEAQMNSPEADLQAEFETACKDGSLYQISVSDLGVMTTVDPCIYSMRGGLNETFVLTTIDGKTISSLHYETIDLVFLASRERNAKRKRLMLTPDFSAWKTNVVIKSNNAGAVKPVFYEGIKQYNAMGGERTETRTR